MPNAHVVVRLKKGREFQPGRGHPWIFSGAVAYADGGAEAGCLARVEDAEGNYLGTGYYNPLSQIRVRLLSRNESEEIDDAWWRSRLEESLRRREHLLIAGETNAVRLVHGEADGLPGLIVDRYADMLVVQALTAAIDLRKQALAGHLMDLAGPGGIYERGDADARRLEGLAPSAGTLMGFDPPDWVDIRESGFTFQVDVRRGQKTGFYLDQRRNRRAVAAWASGRDVLDCFCYTGAFAVYAHRAGAASLTLVDSSRPALETAEEHLRRNGADPAAADLIDGDAFEVLRGFRDARRSFGLIVLDPPRLAPTKAQAGKAARAYKDLNLLAMKLLSPDGILATFSCSAGVDDALLTDILLWAAADAGRRVQVLEELGADEDHPALLTCPESTYLRGRICRVI